MAGITVQDWGEIEVAQAYSESWSVFNIVYLVYSEPLLQCRFALKPSWFAPGNNSACEFVSWRNMLREIKLWAFF